MATGRWGLAAAALLSLLPARAGADGHAWLELASPARDESVRASVALLDVRGRVLEGDARPHALAVLIDLSDSSAWPAGFDVDRDGEVGRVQPWAGGQRLRIHSGIRERVSTDPDDTLAHASLGLAREVIARLDARRYRVALLTFAAHTRVRGELAAPAEALVALDAVAPRLQGGATNLAGAIRDAVRVLERGPASSRSILLLSDGEATAPGSPASAERRALAAADEAARVGVRIDGVLPSRAPAAVEAPLARLARKGMGRVLEVAPGERWAHSLASGAPRALASLSVRNETSGEPARALRSFADGSFDGFVTLAPGANRIEIHARLDDGSELREQRRVWYEVPAHPSAADVAHARALRRALRARTAETELALRGGEPVRALRIETASPAEPPLP